MPKRRSSNVVGKVEVVNSLGKIIASYDSVSSASKLTNMSESSILKLCNSGTLSDGSVWRLIDSKVSMDDITKFMEETKKPKKKVTSSETWKLFERNVSKDFDTTRSPLSGSMKTVTNSDTLHSDIYIECKLRSGASNFMFYDKLVAARHDKRISCMIIENKSTGELIWLMFRDDFMALMKKPELLKDRVYIAVKTSVYKSLLSLYRQTVERAEIEDKIPVIAVKKKGTISYLIGTNPNNFEALHNILKKTEDVRRSR